jgi:hypothetical protein
MLDVLTRVAEWSSTRSISIWYGILGIWQGLCLCISTTRDSMASFPGSSVLQQSGLCNSLTGRFWLLSFTVNQRLFSVPLRDCEKTQGGLGLHKTTMTLPRSGSSWPCTSSSFSLSVGGCSLTCCRYDPFFFPRFMSRSADGCMENESTEPTYVVLEFERESYVQKQCSLAELQ